LGAEVDLLTSVGPDGFGREARELWREEGVGADHVKTGESPTMVGFILVEPGGENRIAVAPGALSELEAADVLAFGDVISASDLCLVSLEIPLGAAVEALRVAREAGTTTLLNPAPAAPLPEGAWELVDYLTPNVSEARTLVVAPPDAGPGELISALREHYANTIVLTLGAGGALVDDGRERTHVAAVRARGVVDTTGAGDAFSAALAVALTEGWDLLPAVRFAAAAGAHAVGTAEVIPSLPYRRDLRTTDLARS
jgi:ribokinase